jgi:hypothetical protein
MLTTVKSEALTLAVWVLAVDAIFIGVYFIAGLRDASSVVKLAFTAVWTVTTLAVVIRGLSRIRIARAGRKPG